MIDDPAQAFGHPAKMSETVVDDTSLVGAIFATSSDSAKNCEHMSLTS